MQDEGIDSNSSGLASSVGDTSNVFTSAALTTSQRYSSISNQMKTNNNHNLMNDSNKVITFKRTSQINGNNNLYGSKAEEETHFEKNHSSNNETKIKKSSNIKNIKNLFFKRGPKRLDSQLSTTTTATYLSSMYSSGSKSPNNIDILNNLEQEQQNFNNLFLAPLLKQSRSNSNSSTSTFSGNLNLNNSYDSNKFNRINNLQNNSNSGKIFFHLTNFYISFYYENIFYKFKII